MHFARLAKMSLLTTLVFITALTSLGTTIALASESRDKWRDGINPNTAHGAWYYRSDTQCVTNHEGGWTSIGYVNHRATYYGRFQMDVSFQRETAYGKWAYSRYGTANNWPPAVQVYHAFEVYRYAGWSRWPTIQYCR